MTFPDHTDPRDHIAIMTRPELIRLMSELPPMHWLRPDAEKRMKELKRERTPKRKSA